MANQGKKTLSVAKILLVDDEVSILSSLSRLLRSEGYEVHCASSASEGFSMLGQHEFALVVSDIKLGSESGIELLAQITEIQEALPVILITGNPELYSAEDPLHLKAFRLFKKPVPIPSFLASVQRAVAFSQMANALERTRAEPAEQRVRRTQFAEAFSVAYVDYQPLVNSHSVVVGHEALLRSAHPRMSSPLSILDAAESLNMIPRLGFRVRHLAMGPYIRHAKPETPSTLFINIHPMELNDINKFVDLYAHGLNGRVCLEITERNAIGDTEDIKKNLLALRDMGYLVAIDDLGAGYASLLSLVAVEPDFVKLDMSLVQGVSSSGIHRSVCASVVKLCQDAGIKTVAEGIEAPEDFECMKDLGCDLFQGYYFARPQRELKWKVTPSPVAPRNN